VTQTKLMLNLRMTDAQQSCHVENVLGPTWERSFLCIMLLFFLHHTSVLLASHFCSSSVTLLFFASSS